MKDFSFTIANPNGFHVRPAGLFAQKMQEFKSDITITRGGQDAAGQGAGGQNAGGKFADGKKLIAVMKLRPKCGQTIVVTAAGEDEDAAINAAENFLKEHL